MTEDELVFEEPPPRRRASRFEALAKTLVNRPGEWARLPGTLGPGYQSYVKRLLGDGFEVTSRVAPVDEQGRRQINIWARYVGGMEPSS